MQNLPFLAESDHETSYASGIDITFHEFDTAVLEGVLFLDTGLFLVTTARHTHTHTHAQRLRLSIYYEPAAAPVSVEHMHI